MRPFYLSAFLVLSMVSVAQTPDYFPLQVGNSWLYRAVKGGNPVPESIEFRSISVDSKESMDGRDYFVVNFFGRTLYLRPDPDGSIVSLNRQSGMEEPWL